MPQLLRRGSRGARKAGEKSQPINGRCVATDMKSTRRCFQVSAQSTIDKIPPGPKLDAITAEKVFGWKNVHKHEGRSKRYRLTGSQSIRMFWATSDQRWRSKLWDGMARLSRLVPTTSRIQSRSIPRVDQPPFLMVLFFVLNLN